MKRYYFDWAATAPPDYFEDGLDIDGGGTAGGAFSLSDIPFGNPSSLHSEGRAARAALEEARRRCASLLQTAPERLFWTSGGTESNFLVLSSILRRSLNSQGAILSSAVEHASIDKSAASFKALGLPFNFIKPEKTGAISEAALKKSLVKHKETALISIIHVQNEVGFINDIAALVRRAKENARRGVHFHCDMVQSLGKIPLSLEDWDVDSASFSAHKIGGPRGIGLLYLKKRLVPLFADESAGGVAGAGAGSAGAGGGGQESGVRSGTENVRGALLFAASLERRLGKSGETLQKNLSEAAKRMSILKAELKSIKRCRIIPEERGAAESSFSPYILQAAFEGVPGELMVRLLDEAGFAVSTSSACSASEKKRRVLEAMGIDAKSAFEGIRISQGWNTTEADIYALLAALKAILKSF